MSKKGQFNFADLIALGRASLIYLSPSLIIIITMLKNGEHVDLNVLYGMGLSILLDLLRRISRETK